MLRLVLALGFLVEVLRIVRILHLYSALYPFPYKDITELKMTDSGVRWGVNDWNIRGDNSA